MSEPIPMKEMRYDLECTLKDIDRCGMIVKYMEAFISDSGGENRSVLRVDLLRWRAYLEKANQLALIIREKMDTQP